MLKLNKKGNVDIKYYNNLKPDDAHNLPTEEILLALDIDEIYYGKFGGH